jgi:hypothetical protein
MATSYATPSTARQRSPATAILKAAGIDPASSRLGEGWGQFLAAQAHSILAVDFFHVETVSCDVIDSAVSSTNTPRSHEVTQ